MVTTEEVLKKYRSKIEQEIATSKTSSEYTAFKEEMLPALTSYERWCHSIGSMIKVKLGPKESSKIQKNITKAHLDITPEQAATLSVVTLLGLFLLVLLSSTAIFLITNKIPLMLSFLGIIASLFAFYYVYSLPTRLANSWRLKASAQMVPAILYVVVYMKHTSNLERAIAFAAEHLEPPLANDFKKIFWDVQVGKFSTVKQSLDNYLETWKDDAPEFVESMHLIESSLFEPSETKRVITLEKSLQVILEGVYEKMLKYSREIRTPLTNLYMLGIILPTLGLALLPLASTLLGGSLNWQHVFVLFNIIIPFFVFYMASEVLLKRPGGYGETSVLEKNPQYHKFTSNKPWMIAGLIALPFFFFAALPFIMQVNFITESLGLKSDYTLEEIGLSFLGTATDDLKLFDFREVGNATVGPFGFFAILSSFALPLGIGIFFITAYRLKTKDLIKSREATKELEKEFTNALFQLGNRLGDGIPAEIAFARVAQTTQGLKTQQFFNLVNQNIQQLGMSIQEALFNPRRGAIIFFPSALIATSMKILVESVKKGLAVAARSLMSISEYVKNIQKIEDRLRDLLAEVMSDMKSNMTFLAPLLAGIVVGLSAMITSILSKLQLISQISGSESEVGGFGNLADIVNIFDVNSMIPPYFIQVSIGIYIVQVIFILTIALVTINAGRDTLKEKDELAKNLIRGVTLYIITAVFATIALLGLSIIALNGLAG